MKLKLIIAFVLTTICSTTFAYNFSQAQVSNMKQAYSYGNKYAKQLPKSRHGDLNLGYIMAAILWQESSAGINCGKNGHAVGPYQNYIPTVKSRMKQNGVTKSNAQIASELKQFDRSAYWAHTEMEYWLKVHNGSMPKALASYNAGWQISKGKSYSSSVIKKAQYLKTNDVLKVEK